MDSLPAQIPVMEVQMKMRTETLLSTYRNRQEEIRIKQKVCI